MNKTNIILASTTLFFTSLAQAFDFGPGSIELPDGYLGPETRDVREQGIIHEFIKKHPGRETGTLLQITVYDFGQKLRPVPESLMLAASENHLLDFIAGQRRHYDNFSYRKMPSLKIDNIPTAHIEWTGNSNGKDMHGIAYCLMKASKVIIFHVRDSADAPLQNIVDAINALAAVDLED